MSNSTAQNVNVIFGKPGSGKSKLVREILKNHKSYSFSYNDTIIPNFCDDEQIKELFEFLSGKEISKCATAILKGEDTSCYKAEESEIVLLQFCYELCSLINMEEPFKTIIFDGVPKTFDDVIMKNIVSLIKYLKDSGYTVYFVTSKENRKKMFEETFGDELFKILT